MAAHGARVAFCTERAAEACRAEGLSLLEPGSEPGAWLLADSASGREDAELLHGATSYLSMLHDIGRNRAYEEALRAVEGDRRLVLDLGAGTGLLALLACRALPSAKAVACEVYGGMARLAECVVSANGLADRVRVANKLASDLEVGPGLDLPERADLCVFELFDSQLLGESIVPILRDAYERLLAPAATVVPCGVRVRAVLVECPALSPANLPELRGAAWPLSLAQLGLTREGEAKAGDGRVAGTAVRPISAEWDALEIDFRRLPPPGPHSNTAEVAIIMTGTAHAVAWWWDLDMGGGGHLSSWTTVATSDAAVADRSHWKPCLSFLAPCEVLAGDCVTVAAVHDDEAVWFAWHLPDTPSPPPRWLEGVTAIPPERERLLMAANAAWARPLHTCAAALGVEASTSGREVLLLPADDGLLLPLLSEASLSAGAGVRATLPPRVAKRLQEAGRLPKQLQLAAESEVQGLSAHFAALLFEPCATADAHPWSVALGVRRRMERAMPLLAPSGKAFPTCARLLAQLVACRGAWLARRPLSRTCGLDLAAANASLVPRRSAPLSCSLCELAWSALSPPTPLLDLSLGLCQGSAGPWLGNCALQPDASGECHAVALWVDFDLGGESTWLSTGPPPAGAAPTGWSQALQLLDVPLVVAASGQAVRLEAALSVEGELELEVLAPGTDRALGEKRRRLQV
mmetsp:Transcript_49329/g.142957  ORF Transcript_49329/g.142957 Transcript_49329/m.142957 type:complete len:691 (+) Transcript_49329:24-2096(+)